MYFGGDYVYYRPACLSNFESEDSHVILLIIMNKLGEERGIRFKAVVLLHQALGRYGFIRSTVFHLYLFVENFFSIDSLSVCSSLLQLSHTICENGNIHFGAEEILKGNKIYMYK